MADRLSKDMSVSNIFWSDQIILLQEFVIRDSSLNDAQKFVILISVHIKIPIIKQKW